MSRLSPGRLPIHPFLLAAYPILFLFGQNVAEVDPSQLWLPLAVALAVTGVVFAVLTLVLRNPHRAAVITSAAVVVFFGYGHVLRATEPLGLTGGPLFLACVVALGAVVALVLIRRHAWERVTPGANLVGAILVGLATFTIVQGGFGAAPGASVERPGISAPPGGTDRDIYYIILDRYGSERVLRDRVGVTETALYARLPDLGFTVVPDSQTNYPQTLHSLAASLNVRYLDDVAAAQGKDTVNTRALTELVQEHEVGRFLKSRGYRYVHIGSWWDVTETNRLADVNLVAEGTSDFVTTLADTTALRYVGRWLKRLGVTGVAAAQEDGRRRHYDASVFAFDQLDRIAAMPGPKFAFIHILLPHGPYVFSRDGSFVPAGGQAGRSVAEAFTEQLAYTDARIGAFLESLVSLPEERQPIIVLQADEGPHPRRYDLNEKTFQWLDATPAELDEKFGILNAFLLPGDEAPDPWPGISPVNNFRLVLEAYFDADLPRLPDRHYVYTDRQHPYDLRDVTDRVRPLAGGS